VFFFCFAAQEFGFVWWGLLIWNQCFLAAGGVQRPPVLEANAGAYDGFKDKRFDGHENAESCYEIFCKIT
jgi:hypothetical protein